MGVNTTLPTTDLHVEGEALITGNLNVTHNVFATNVNFEDAEVDSLHVTDTTQSTSKTTGAVRVAGGLGVDKDIHATNVNFEHAELDSLHVTDTTQSTSKTTGVVRLAGGLGVSKDIHATNVNFETTETDNIYVTDTTASTSKITGAAKVAGGLGVAGDIHTTNLTTEGDIFAKTDLTVTENAYVSNNLTVTKNVIVSGDVSTTSKTTGALTVVGGVGVQGNVHATHVNFEDAEIDSLTVTDTAASTSVTTGAAKIAGGLGVSGNVYASNVIAAGDSYGKFTGPFLSKNDATTEGEAFMENLNAGEMTTQSISVLQEGVASTISNPIVISYDSSNWRVNGEDWNDEFHFTFIEGYTYVFDISNSNMAAQASGPHKGYFAITGDFNSAHQSTPYEFGVKRVGVQGSSGAQLRWTVPRGASSFQGGGGGSHPGPGNFYFFTKPIVTGVSTFPGQLYERRIQVIANPDDHILTGQTHVHGLLNAESINVESVNVTNTTPSTSVTTGAAKIAGGVGVSGSVYASNVIVAGDSYGKFTSSFLSKRDATIESEAFMKNLNAGERTTQHINGSQSGGTAISTVGEPAGVITVKNPIIINFDIRNWLVGWTELAPWPQPGSLAMNAGAPSEAAYIGNGTAFWWNDVFNFTFVEGLTYIFDISHVSNQVQAGGSGPGYFGITGDQGYGYQSIPYDFGVERIGTQGTSGAQFRWTVPRGASTFQGRSTGSHAGPGNFYFFTKSVNGSPTAPGQTYNRIIHVIPNPDDHLLSGQIRISGLLNTDTVNVNDTTSSTSTTTGAVKIAGGLGVVGNVYADTFYGDGSNLTGTFSMTSITTTSDVDVGGNISIGGLTQNKIPYVGAGKYLADSHITHSTDATTITSNLEVLGNVVVGGKSLALDSESLVINDRVIGIANNNSSHLLDVGIVMQHPGKNIGLIHHGAATENDPHDHTFTIGYTQNTVTDNHILDDSNLITVEILGNLITQNNLTVSDDAIITGSTPSTSKTTGALRVAGGVGIVGDVYAESGDFSSLVTTSNVATTNLTASDTIHTTNINIIDTVTTTNVATTNLTASDTIHTTNVATTNLTASDTIHTTNLNITDTITTTNVATTNVTASDTIHTTNLNITDTITTTNVATTNVTASDTIHTSNLVASDTVKVTNGLITNLGGLTRKTYSYSSGTITASTTPEINVVFANQMFSAKITAHLVEPTSNISVLNLDVTGGTGRDIGKGFLSITGDENSKHWNSTIATTDTTVTLTPSVGLISNGTYGIHVEHTSPLGVGGVTSIDKDNTVETTFNY